MPSPAVPDLRLTLSRGMFAQTIYIYIYTCRRKISDDADKAGFAKGGWGLQAHIGEKLLLALAGLKAKFLEMIRVHTFSGHFGVSALF